MRLRLLLAILFLAAGPALAVPLPFAGSLRVDLRSSGVPEESIFLDEIVLSGAGVADVAGGGFSLPAGAFSGSFDVETPPTSFPYSITYGTLTNLAGTFAPGAPPDVVGSMGIDGSWLLGLFGVPPLVVVDQPLGSIGIGGSDTTVSNTPPGSNVITTFAGQPYTSGTATVLLYGITTFSISGFDARDTAGLGAIRLVSPYVVTNNLNVDQPIFVGVATLDLTFVPEPGTATLLGVGLAALGAAAARGRLS